MLVSTSGEQVTSGQLTPKDGKEGQIYSLSSEKKRMLYAASVSVTLWSRTSFTSFFCINLEEHH